MSLNFLNISSYLQPYLYIFQTLHENNFHFFIFAIGLILTLVRLFIPYGLTVFGASVILLPFASLQGINPWLMGFLILLFSKESLFPTIRSTLKTFLDETLVYDPQPRTIILKYHLLIIVVKFLAVYCSITFWKEMSLI